MLSYLIAALLMTPAQAEGCPSPGLVKGEQFSPEGIKTFLTISLSGSEFKASYELSRSVYARLEAAVHSENPNWPLIEQLQDEEKRLRAEQIRLVHELGLRVIHGLGSRDRAIYLRSMHAEQGSPRLLIGPAKENRERAEAVRRELLAAAECLIPDEARVKTLLAEEMRLELEYRTLADAWSDSLFADEPPAKRIERLRQRYHSGPPPVVSVPIASSGATTTQQNRPCNSASGHGLACSSRDALHSLPRAKPMVKLERLIDPVADYPDRAERNLEQGLVKLDLLVGPNGRVSDCDVTRSSGSDLLDRNSCRLIRSRARFVPVLDKRGLAVPSRYRHTIRWKLPHRRLTAAFSAHGHLINNVPGGGAPVLRTDPFEGRYPPKARNREAGTIVYSVRIDRTGRVTDCAIRQSSGSRILDEATCTVLKEHGRYSPARDEAGRPLVWIWNEKMTWAPPAHSNAN